MAVFAIASHVIRLVEPDARYHASFNAGLREMAATTSHIDGLGLPTLPDLDRLEEPAAFARLAEQLRADALEDSPRPSGWVPSTIRFVVDADDRFVGVLQIRHRLTPALARLGGHMGYSIIPSARRRGYAKAAAQLALPLAAELGIERVLVTCHESNVASRAVIECVGGRCEDSIDGIRRYCIATSP